MEMLILGVIAVLLFGKRLPEVGRSIGKGLSEFKKGINDVSSEVKAAAAPVATSDDISAEATSSNRRQAPSAPRFEPPTEEDPQVEETAAAG